MACQFDARMLEIKHNLRAFYRATEPLDRSLGVEWYATARRIVMEWATHYGYHDATVACVIAAISPQCDWERNLIIADDVLANRPVSISGALHVNIEKAKRLRDEWSTTGTMGCNELGDVESRMVRVFPHGPKVCSFAANLAGIDDYVTIDGHAMQAALNDPTADYRLRWQPYTVFARCYAEVAREVGHKPCDFQAIIWHHWKRQYPRMVKHAIRKTTRQQRLGRYQ